MYDIRYILKKILLKTLGSGHHDSVFYLDSFIALRMLPVRVSTLASTLHRGLRIGAVGMSQLRRACSTERGLVPRRAMLYVPGNDERKVLKVTTLDVDCAVLDCEDGVALNKKVWNFL